MDILGFYLGRDAGITSIYRFTLIFENCLNEFRDRNIYKLDPKNSESQYSKIHWSCPKGKKGGREGRKGKEDQKEGRDGERI